MDFSVEGWAGRFSGAVNDGKWRNSAGVVESLWACDASLLQDLNAYLAAAAKRSPSLRYATLQARFLLPKTHVLCSG